MSETGFRGFDQANPCPICDGYRWGGSDVQCLGGMRLGHPYRIWCTNMKSDEPSSSRKSWSHRLDTPYEFTGEAPRRGPKPDHVCRYIFTDRRCPSVPPTYRFDLAHPYEDADGGYLFEIVDHRPKPGHEGRKECRPRVLHPKHPDLCRWCMCEIRREPYKLVELLAGIKAGREVLFCEGETDVLAAMEAGHVATTVAFGTWEPWFPSYFKGCKRVIVVADRDKKGMLRARDAEGYHVANELRWGVRLSSCAITEEHGIENDALLLVELPIPDAVLAEYEITQGEKSYREFLVPLHPLNDWAHVERLPHPDDELGL